MAQTLQTPDVEAQRAAMKKLDFLIGEWFGEASVLRGLGQFAELMQTESAQFKLDGLALMMGTPHETEIYVRLQKINTIFSIT